MKNALISFLIVLRVSLAPAQTPINAFANVSAISGTTLTVSSVNETYHSFEDGDYVIIMQMQDDVIGANTTTNSSTFGDLGAINSAGLYEVAQIQSHTESASLPTSIVLTTALTNNYNIGVNSSVQLITYRFLGSNFTSTASIGTFTWNGTIGGVTAMSVTNVLTLGHSISANAAGFRGGTKNTPNGYTACDNTTYATAIATRYAAKGEGIYKRTNAAWAGGRGKILNGGGGGNDVNAGGGGGGNYLGGGSGGSGWTSSGTGCSPIAGGLGALSLSTSISGSRIFMGGGGGGGHENDNNGTAGAAGGGIILIKAGTLTTISCAGISITATGSTAVNASNDGGGGGGAGGSIIFLVNTFSVAAACPLTISANGGNGGNSNASSAGAHGGGGGGGQGVIIYSGPQPTTNVTANTIPGNGGVSCSGCAAAVNGSAGSGPNNSGLVVNATVPLPVELVSFYAATDVRGQVVLDWRTAIEKNAKEFIIQRMTDEMAITEIAHVPSTGSYSQYRYTDGQPVKGTSYYRLNQVDLDGIRYPKQWESVNTEQNGVREMLVYPNPLPRGKKLKVEYDRTAPGLVMDVLDLRSSLLLQEILSPESQDAELDTSLLEAGVYILKIQSGNLCTYKKLVISEQ
jgi:hypothetical protein